MKAKLKRITMDNLSDDQDPSISVQQVDGNDIAIIGISLKFPQADSPYAFWENIRNGKDCMMEIPEERRHEVLKYLNFANDTVYNREFTVGGYIEGIDRFDYSFFNIPPMEAKLMDPNQRLFLGVVWKVFEDAGYNPVRLKGSKIGSFVGYGGSTDYQQMIMNCMKESLSMALTGNLHPIIASRISHILDFRGPSMLINTTCSSSLVAVHYACESIRRGECDMALAGGTAVYPIPLRKTYIGVESSDSRTKAFDDSSDGTGTGEGSAVILLKPLAKAVQDRDHIYAVIKGSAVNHDGRSAGLIVPNAKAQEEVIVEAWQNAKINPLTISYIEAHGTGTKLGDPIEIEGMNNAFRRYSTKRHFCGVGSVKTNIGHLDEAAGIAGLIKCALSLKHKEIPPSLHFNRPNRLIRFEETAVYVNKHLTRWDPDDYPRRCGVNSFGLSGTNCHVILEEAPESRARPKRSDAGHILALSAKTRKSLEALIDSYAQFLDNRESIDLDNLCFTANAGRSHYGHRAAIIAADYEDLRNKLNRLSNEKLESFHAFGFYYKEYATEKGDKTPINRMHLDAKADERIQRLSESTGAAAMELLHEIAMLYVSGADINWNDMSYGCHQKMSLPTYFYDKKKCWIDIPEVSMPNTSISANAAEPFDPLLFSTKWEKSRAGQRQPEFIDGIVVFFEDGSGAGSRLIPKLSEYCQEVVRVRDGATFARSSLEYTVPFQNSDDIAALFDQLKEKKICKMIFMSTEHAAAKSPEEFEASFNRLFHLFHIAKYFVSAIREPVELVLVTKNAQKVTGKETQIIPHNASVLALGKVIAQENPYCTCRAVDIDDYTTEDQLLGLLSRAETAYQIAYRHDESYIEVFEKYELPMEKPERLRLTSDGVYVITGGLGRKGLAIAKKLADESDSPIRLVFIDSKKVPKRMEWTSYRGEDHAWASKLAILMGIEQAGHRIDIYEADIGDHGRVKEIFEELHRNYGRIHGVIHNASIGGEGFMIRKSIDAFKAVLKPKVYGAWNVYDATKRDPLEFYVLFASAISMTGARGMGDYTAANGYIDAFRAFLQLEGVPSTTIYWTAWEGGHHEVLNHSIEEINIFESVPKEKLLQSFARIMNDRPDKVIIGKLRTDPAVLNRSITRYGPILAAGFLTALDKPDKTKVKAWQDSGILHASHLDDISMEVADAWKSVLGFDEIDPDANLFELGGNSILTSKVRGILDKQFPGALTLSDFFKYPTVRELSQYLSSQSGEQSIQGSEQHLEQIIEKHWRTALGFEELNLNDNFFELGGDSILLMGVYRELDRSFPGVLTLTDLFRYPSVAELAGFMRQRIQASSPSPISSSSEPAKQDHGLDDILNSLEKGELLVDDAVRKWNK